MSATFRAMTTDVTVAVPRIGARGELRAAQHVADAFERSEQRFSRFRADSELSRLNRSRGPFRASAPMFAALLRARRYVALTGGVFDPAIGSALVAAGYDRSFCRGALDRPERSAQPARRASFDDITLDESTLQVERPEHVQIDLGGFIKGWTVDEAARDLPDPAALDAGGDAVLRGDGPTGDGWLVDVEDPVDAGRVVLTLVVRNRAVATSAGNRRRWRIGDREHHHLIDPRTGEPSRTDLAQVTVIAASAELADVLAKTAYLLGRVAGTRFLEAQRDAGCVLVATDGSISVLGEASVFPDE